MAREHLFFFGDIVNSINDQLLHPTPWGMAKMTRPLGVDASAGRRAEVGPNSAFRHEALFDSFWIAGSLARMLLEEGEFDSEEFENGLYARGIQTFKTSRSDRAAS